MRLLFINFFLCIYINSLCQLPNGVLIHLRADSIDVPVGSNVTSWQDISGNGYSANAVTGFQSPILDLNTVLNKKAVKFDGNLDLLLINLGQSFPQPTTVFILWRVNSSVPVQIPIASWPNLNALLTNSGQIWLNGGSGQSYYSKPLPFSFILSTCVFNGSTSQLYENSVLQNTRNSGSNSMGFELEIGGLRAQASSFPTIPGWLNGDIAEIIIYNDLLSPSDRLSVENYISEYYTTPLSLGPDINTCGTSQLLQINSINTYTSILWSNGQMNTTSINVNSNGWHWVEVNSFGRTMRDSIFVSGLVPTPQLNLTQNQTICFGNSLNINYTNTLPSGITAQWSTGETGNSISVSEPGSYAVVFQNANGCQISSQTLEVAVNYFPQTQGLGEDRTFCLNSQLFFEYGNLGISPYTHLWGNGSVSGSIPITQLGLNEYTVSVTDAMGCIAHDTVLINLVNVDGPVLSFLYDTTCVYTPTTFTDNSIIGDGDEIISYVWIFPSELQNGSSEAVYTPITNQPYPVELHLITALGCQSSFRDTVVMLPEPQVMFVIPPAICQGSEVLFQANQSTPETIVNWQWIFGSLQTPIGIESGSALSFVFPSHGNTNITLIGTDINGCTDTLMQTTFIRPRPQVLFSFQEACAGNLVQFTNQSTIAPPALISGQTWTFHDAAATTQVNPARIYSNAGFYNVTLQVNGNNGCSAQQTQQVQIHAFPVLNYTTDAACAGITSQFNDASSVPNGFVDSVRWIFNGGTILHGANVSHTFSTGGNNQITHRVVSDFGCVRSLQYNINLTPLLAADFEINPNVIIADYPIQFENTSIGQVSNSWWFNGEELFDVVSPELIFSDEQIGDGIEVMLIVGNNVCYDTIVRNYTVLENRTDLAVKQLFVSEMNGFYTIGVELENKGSTPIIEADIFLSSPHIGLIKETWTGNLDAGESEIFILSAQISSVLSADKSDENYICVEAEITAPLQFFDQDLSNNSLCKSLSDENGIVVLTHPNPTRDKYNIQLLLPSSQEITIKLFDAMGREIAVLESLTLMPAGMNSLEIDASKWPSGMYYMLVYSEQYRVLSKLSKID
jgi:PKD repeat protein